MTISQALKEKNKKIAKISKTWLKISKHNSLSEGEEQPYDLDKLWEEYNSEIEGLIDIKTRIHEASAPVRRDIFLLSELKSKVQSIRSLNTTNGTFKDRYSSEAAQVTAHFSTTWKDATVDLIEVMIESIQEKLDAFNHTTQI